MGKTRFLGDRLGHAHDGSLGRLDALGTQLLTLFVVTIAGVHVLEVAEAFSQERHIREQFERGYEFQHVFHGRDLSLDTRDDDLHKLDKVFPLEKHFADLVHLQSSGFSKFSSGDGSVFDRLSCGISVPSSISRATLCGGDSNLSQSCCFLLCVVEGFTCCSLSEFYCFLCYGLNFVPYLVEAETPFGFSPQFSIGIELGEVEICPVFFFIAELFRQEDAF